MPNWINFLDILHQSLQQIIEVIIYIIDIYIKMSKKLSFYAVMYTCIIHDSAKLWV